MFRQSSARRSVVLSIARGFGQELEPRAYSVSPGGTNFVVFAYGRSAGDLSFDPTLPIEDAKASVNTASVGYFRSFNFLGRSANVALAVPYLLGSTEGRLADEFQAITRSGLPDPWLRFGINLVGAPAMDLKEFVNYRQKSNLGASLVVVAPIGQYDPNKLINIESNRWAFKPELGLSRAIGRSVLDFYAGAWLFTANDNFQGRIREQDPIGTTQFHLSYNLRRRLWAAFDANFFVGGRTTVNGIRRLDFQRNSRIGTTVSIPLSRRQSVKVAFSTGAFTTIGADFIAFAIGYQYLWGVGL